MNSGWTRRAFLKTAAAGVALALPRAGKAAGSMFVSLNASLTKKMEWPEFARLAATTGYGGVDVNLSAAQPQGADATRALLRELKLRPGAINLPVQFAGDAEVFRQGLARLRDAAAFAAAIDCPRMVTVLPPSSATPKEQLRPLLRDRVASMAEILQRSNVRLALEFLGPMHFRTRQPHEFIWRMDEALEFGKECGENVGLLLDAWHWHHAGATAGDIKAAGRARIVHIHVSDARPQPPEEVRDNQRLLPGEGIIDLVTFFRTLEEIGYTEAVSPEPLGRIPESMSSEEGARLGLSSTTTVMRNAGVFAPAAAARSQPADTRMAWWRDARFGMFIHWGLYAVPAGDYKGHRSKEIGEWIMSWANIPRAEYERFAAQFDPVKFDAARWVQIAKDAGMKYMVITSKHHDGFSMFDSAVSDYDIVDATPFKRDPMRGLADECRRQGIRFAFYYSIMDWHHPSQYVDAPGKYPTAGNGQTKMLEGKKPEYVAYMKAQLRELITKYDPAILWFDGEWVNWWTEEDGQDLYAYVRGLKPDILINNRVGKGRRGMQGMNKTDRQYSGDFGTPEQQIPASGLPGIDWESCMTMNDTWGYKSYDDNWKSAPQLIRNLIDIVSKGGNYLLNVGPTPEGEIPAPSVERLAAIGRWLAVNGEAVYGTTASPFGTELPWGRVTRKHDALYLHVFDWPANHVLTIPAFDAPLRSATLLAAPRTPLAVSQTADGWSIALPENAPDPVASVIKINS
jgi:alpha-L-fucosidase